MSNNFKALTPFRGRNESIKISDRLRRRYSDPDFIPLMGRLRSSISAGSSLHEARVAVLPDNASDLLWEDMVHALAMSFANPAYVMLEWQIKQQDRYKRAAAVFDGAFDNEEKLKALMIMQKIDEHDLELKKALGIIKPLDDDQGRPIPLSEEEIKDAERRFRAEITSALAVQDSVRPAISADVLDVTHTGSETNSLEQIAVDDKSAG